MPHRAAKLLWQFIEHVGSLSVFSDEIGPKYKRGFLGGAPGRRADVGQITRAIWYHAAPVGLLRLRQNACAGKRICCAGSTRSFAPPGAGKNCAFVFAEFVIGIHPSRLNERGVRAVVTRREAGRRWTCRVAARLWLARTNNIDADDEAVWSWPPDAEVKPAVRRESVGAGDGGKTAGPQGERGVSVKTIAQGRLGSSGCTCGSCPVHSCSHGGHGRQPTPSLPCALD